MLTVLIYGAVTSAIYAMLAVGFTLIFGVARILNLAHGAFYALGAYGAYSFTALLKLPLSSRRCCRSRWWRCSAWRWSGCWCGRCAARSLAVLMITLTVALTVEQVLFIAFGSQSKNVPAFVNFPISVHGVVGRRPAPARARDRGGR